MGWTPRRFLMIVVKNDKWKRETVISSWTGLAVGIAYDVRSAAAPRHLDYHAHHLSLSASKSPQNFHQGNPGFASVENCRCNTSVEENLNGGLPSRWHVAALAIAAWTLLALALGLFGPVVLRRSGTALSFFVNHASRGAVAVVVALGLALAPASSK